MKNILLPKVFQPFYCNNLVRIGKQNDGGYLVNLLDINKSEVLISFGIGQDTSFEVDFLAINDCQLRAYDGTISKLHDYLFTSPKRKLELKNVGADISFLDIIKNKNNIYLKCDIDGSEYGILFDILLSVEKFTGIAIEFHNISNYKKFNELTNFISKIDLILVHTHINNYSYIETTEGFIPDVIELTFSCSKENTEIRKNISSPHHLDMPNNPNDDDFTLCF